MRLYGEERSDEEIRRFVLDYKRKIETDPHNRYVVVRDLVPRGARVLDYGCGWGAFSKMLEERGHEVLGIEVDDNQVEICRLVWGDSQRLRFEGTPITELAAASFECVVSNEVIEHVHNPGTYLHEINRVLKPDGRLVISLPNVMTPRLATPLVSPRLLRHLKGVSEQTRRDYRKEQHHIQAWDPVHLVRLVSTVGFALEDYRPMEGIPLPKSRFWPSYVRFRPLRNFSYSMAFAFRRVQESRVAVHD